MSDEQPPTVKIHTTFVEKINFACDQSAFAVLRELKTENLGTEQDLSDLSVTLEASPAFLKRKTRTVDHLAAGGLLSPESDWGRVEIKPNLGGMGYEL